MEPWTQVALLALRQCSWSPLGACPRDYPCPRCLHPLPPRADQAARRQYLQPISSPGCQPEGSPRAFRVILDSGSPGAFHVILENTQLRSVSLIERDPP